MTNFQKMNKILKNKSYHFFWKIPYYSLMGTIGNLLTLTYIIIIIYFYKRKSIREQRYLFSVKKYENKEMESKGFITDKYRHEHPEESSEYKGNSIRVISTLDEHKLKMLKAHLLFIYNGRNEELSNEIKELESEIKRKKYLLEDQRKKEISNMPIII